MPGAASLWTSPPRPPHRSLVANLAAANCYKKDHFDSPAIQEVVSKVEYIYITVRHSTPAIIASGVLLGH